VHTGADHSLLFMLANRNCVYAQALQLRYQHVLTTLHRASG